MNDMDLPALIEAFNSEERCRKYLAALRWPNGVRCLKCGAAHVYTVHTRGRYECAEKICRHQFSVTAGTIFHDSHLPLWKWMLTAYMMVEAKKGVSANQLKRTLKVSYKTAWYLCHRVRAAMQDAAPRPLTGIVEVDETYVGGKLRGVGRGNYRANKTVVIGAVARDGRVRMKVIPAAKQKHMTGFIKEVTDPSAEIYTDDHVAYRQLPLRGRAHKSVNHSADEWVRADVHTQTVESVWSLFKRSLIGSYHHMSVKHMPAYLDEIAFKHDNRNNQFMFRDTILKLIDAKAMPFRTLVDQGS
jgi:transposase-like protein